MRTFEEQARIDARIITLQTELLDHSGHVWPLLAAARRRTLVRQINRLRDSNGWKPLDMRGR